MQQPSSADKARTELQSIVIQCLFETCGGGATCAWRDSIEKLVASTISLTCSKTDSLEGKPWDIEIRTARSYFCRFKDTFGNLITESDLNLVRTFSSADEFASFLIPSMEETCRSISLCLDIRCSDSGILYVTTRDRMMALRENGKLPCPHCCQWLKGEKGVWWHTQLFHQLSHQDAMENAAAVKCVNAIIVYEYDSLQQERIQGTMQSKYQVPTNVSSLSELSSMDPCELVKRGDVQSLEQLIGNGFSPSDYIDSKGASLLLWAAGAGQVNMVKHLIQKEGCDPNFAQRGKRGFRGRTALHWAARNGHLEVVVYLVDVENVDLEAKTVDGTTAFCWAAWQGHVSVMQYLHSKQCDINSVNSFGCNAVLWAAQGDGSPDTIRWLDSVGCSSMLLNDNQHGLLHKAAQRGRRNLCEWFLREKILVLSLSQHVLTMIGPDTEGCLPSDLAGMEGFEELAVFLSEEERMILESVLVQKGRQTSSLPAWLVQHECLMVADSIWEPWAGVRRLRVVLGHCMSHNL